MSKRNLILSSLLVFSTACAGAAGSVSPTGPSSTATTPSPLEVEVFTSPDRAGAVNSTIVFGGQSALVIDAQYTKSGANAVADIIDASGKQLTHIFITHAHPDHYFGAVTLVERFPEAKVIAAPEVVEGMEATAAAKAVTGAQQLGPEFPGAPLIPERVEGDNLVFEGHTLRLLRRLQGDTNPVTGVVLPDNGVAVLSDVLFSGVHVWTADSDANSRTAWIAQLDALQDLAGVTRFVPGHQSPDADQSAAALVYTRGYIEAFHAQAQPDVPSDAIIEAMSSAYPDAGGAFFLQLGAKVAAGEMKWE